MESANNKNTMGHGLIMFLFYKPKLCVFQMLDPARGRVMSVGEQEQERVEVKEWEAYEVFNVDY